LEANKSAAITRSFSLLYTLCLLTLLTRIQLNLLGRRNYLSSVVSLASHPLQDPTISLENHDDDNVEQSYGNDFETNRKFLTFSWWLLHRGWREIMQKVEAAVKDIFGPLNPREDIQLDRLSALILDVRRKVEGETPEERKYGSPFPPAQTPRKLNEISEPNAGFPTSFRLLPKNPPSSVNPARSPPPSHRQQPTPPSRPPPSPPHQHPLSQPLPPPPPHPSAASSTKHPTSSTPPPSAKSSPSSSTPPSPTSPTKSSAAKPSSSLP